MDHARLARLGDRLLKSGRGPSIAPTADAGGLSPEARAMYERLRPFAEAMLLVMTADASIVAGERDTLRGALRTLTGGVLSSAAMEQMIAEADAALARDGRELRLDVVASALYGDKDDAELGLALAAAVAVADGKLGPVERAIIDALAERLGKSPADVRALLAQGD